MEELLLHEEAVLFLPAAALFVVGIIFPLPESGFDVEEDGDSVLR